MQTELIQEMLSKISCCSLINGKQVQDSDAITFDVESPLTGEKAYSVFEATDTEIQKAIRSANSFFDKTRLDKSIRRHILLELADRIEKNQDELSALESFDTGRKLGTVRGWDIGNTIDTLKYYASVLETEQGDLIQTKNGVVTFTSYRPIGVCAALASWNFALVCFIWKLAPALAAGCPIIIKPSERAPLSSLYISQLISQSNLIPKDMIHVLQGGGDKVGTKLIQHEKIQRISLTGGYDTANKVINERVNNFSRLSFELGGKSAMVITDNSDVDSALDCAVWASFAQQGQDCCASSLIFVHDDIFDSFKDKFSAKVRECIKAGSQFDEDTTYGPIICSDHKNKLMKDIKLGIEAGGNDILAGTVDLPEGNFLAPVAFTGLDIDASINQKELFGPITSLIPFNDLKEVTTKINSLNYGLYVSIWEANAEKALRFCEDLDVVNCWINTYGIFDPAIPWGGKNKSGIGADNGIDNYYDHLQKKVFSITNG